MSDTSTNERVQVDLTREEAEVLVAELDAMGHSRPGEHEGDPDDRCPACDFLDRVRAELAREGLQ